MGRPKKSIAEHKANGTYKPSRHDFTPMELSSIQDVEMPGGLHEDSQSAWQMIVPELIKNDAITIVDVPILYHAFYCHTIAMKCKDMIEKGDADLFECNKLYRYNMTEWSNIIYKFGISPMERGKIKAPEKPVTDDNNVNDLLGLQGQM